MTTQITLAGEEADDRVRPETLLWCQDCKQWLLRSRQYNHEHRLYRDPDEYWEEVEKEMLPPWTPSDDAPEKVGNWYTVRMHYSVEYAIRVPAYDRGHAKQMADEERMARDLRPVDSFHVHTDVDVGEAIYEDDDAAEEHDLLP